MAWHGGLYSTVYANQIPFSSDNFRNYLNSAGTEWEIIVKCHGRYLVLEYYVFYLMYIYGLPLIRYTYAYVTHGSGVLHYLCYVEQTKG